MNNQVILDSSFIDASIERQAKAKASLRIFAAPTRRLRKTITKTDVAAAVSAKLDELDREFRRLGVEFPAYRIAYDTARVVVKNAREVQS